jgi:hypothetical protein
VHSLQVWLPQTLLKPAGIAAGQTSLNLPTGSVTVGTS